MSGSSGKLLGCRLVEQTSKANRDPLDTTAGAASRGRLDKYPTFLVGSVGDAYHRGCCLRMTDAEGV